MASFNRKAPELMLTLGLAGLRSELKNAQRDFQPDLICAHHSRVSGFFAWKFLSQEKSDTPYVVVDHEVGDFIECETSPAHQSLMKKVTGNAACSITVSKTMEKLAKEALPDSDFRTIYNGSSFPLVARDKEEKGSQIIFCCSKFYGRKDIPLPVSYTHLTLPTILRV